MPASLSFDDVLAEGLTPQEPTPIPPPVHPDLKFDDVLDEGLKSAAPPERRTPSAAPSSAVPARGAAAPSPRPAFSPETLARGEPAAQRGAEQWDRVKRANALRQAVSMVARMQGQGAAEEGAVPQRVAFADPVADAAPLLPRRSVGTVLKDLGGTFVARAAGVPATLGAAIETLGDISEPDVKVQGGIGNIGLRGFGRAAKDFWKGEEKYREKALLSPQALESKNFAWQVASGAVGSTPQMIADYVTGGAGKMKGAVDFTRSLATSAVEGNTAGAQGRIQAEQYVAGLPEDQLATIPGWQDLLNKAGGDTAKARAAAAKQAGMRTYGMTFLTTTLASLIADKATKVGTLDKWMQDPKSKITMGRIAALAGVEGGTEAIQSGLEQLVLNINTGQPAMKGVIEAIRVGGATGALMGGTLPSVAAVSQRLTSEGSNGGGGGGANRPKALRPSETTPQTPAVAPEQPTASEAVLPGVLTRPPRPEAVEGAAKGVLRPRETRRLEPTAVDEESARLQAEAEDAETRALTPKEPAAPVAPPPAEPSVVEPAPATKPQPTTLPSPDASAAKTASAVTPEPTGVPGGRAGTGEVDTTVKQPAPSPERVAAKAEGAKPAATKEPTRRTDGSLKYEITTDDGTDITVNVVPPGWNKGSKSFEVLLDRTGGPKDAEGKPRWYATVTVGKYRSENVAKRMAELAISRYASEPAKSPAPQPAPAPAPVAATNARSLIAEAMKRDFAKEGSLDVTDDWQAMTPKERQDAVANGLHIETDRSGKRILANRSQKSIQDELRATVMAKQAAKKSTPAPVAPPVSEAAKPRAGATATEPGVTVEDALNRGLPVTVPKGATMIRVTDAAGRQSVLPVDRAKEFANAGPFKKVEAGIKRIAKKGEDSFKAMGEPVTVKGEEAKPTAGKKLEPYELRKVTKEINGKSREVWEAFDPNTGKSIGYIGSTKTELSQKIARNPPKATPTTPQPEPAPAAKKPTAKETKRLEPVTPPEPAKAAADSSPDAYDAELASRQKGVKGPAPHPNNPEYNAVRKDIEASGYTVRPFDGTPETSGWIDHGAKVVHVNVNGEKPAAQTLRHERLHLGLRNGEAWALKQLNATDFTSPEFENFQHWFWTQKADVLDALARRNAKRMGTTVEDATDAQRKRLTEQEAEMIRDEYAAAKYERMNAGPAFTKKVQTAINRSRGARDGMNTKAWKAEANRLAGEGDPHAILELRRIAGEKNPVLTEEEKAHVREMRPNDPEVEMDILRADGKAEDVRQAELNVGDAFTRNGVKYRIAEEASDGFIVKGDDGVEITLPYTETASITIDKGSLVRRELKKKAAPLTLESTTSAQLKAEQKTKDAAAATKAQKEEVAQRAAKPLAGSAGNVTTREFPGMESELKLEEGTAAATKPEVEKRVEAASSLLQKPEESFKTWRDRLPLPRGAVDNIAQKFRTRLMRDEKSGQEKGVGLSEELYKSIQQDALDMTALIAEEYQSKKNAGALWLDKMMRDADWVARLQERAWAERRGDTLQPRPGDVVDVSDSIKEQNKSVTSALAASGWTATKDGVTKTFDTPGTGGVLDVKGKTVSLSYRGTMPVLEVGWESHLVPEGATPKETAAKVESEARRLLGIKPVSGDADTATVLEAAKLMRSSISGRQTFDPWDMAGDRMKPERQAVMSKLLGREATIAESGVTAISAEFAKRLGVRDNTSEVSDAIRAAVEGKPRPGPGNVGVGAMMGTGRAEPAQGDGGARKGVLRPRTGPTDQSESTAGRGVGAAGKVTTSAYDPEMLFDTTGVTHAYNDMMAERRGRGKRTPQDVKHDEELMAELDTKLTADPDAGRRLVDAINDGKQKVTTDLDVALLLHETVRAEALENEAKSIDASLAGKTDPASNAERAKNAIRMEAAQQRLDDIYRANSESGSDAGRAFRARQLMMNDAGDLVRMQTRRRVVNGGKTTEPQDAETLAIHKEFKDIFEKMNERMENMPEGPAKDAELARLRKMLESVRDRWTDAIRRDKLNPKHWIDALDAYLKERRAVLPPGVRERAIAELTAASKIPDEAQRNQAIMDAIDKVNAHVGLKTGDWFDAYVYTNMLSNPMSHVRNSLGNLTNQMFIRPMGLVARGKVGEAATYLKKSWGAVLNGDAWQAAVKAFRKGETNKWIEGLDDPDVSAFQRQQRIHGPKRKYLRPAWKTLTFVGRFMEAQDKYFGTMIEAGETARLLRAGEPYDIARSRAEALANKYLYRDKLNGAPDKSLDAVTQSLERMGHWLDHARRIPYIGRAAKLTIPFLKTPVKIAQFNTELSALGYIGANRNRIAKAHYNGVTYNEMVGQLKSEQLKAKPDPELVARLKNQIDEVDVTHEERLGKAAIGTMFTVLGFIAAATGNTTWAAPQDPKAKKLFYDAGYKPFSFRVGNRWIPMMYLGPAMIAFALPAAMRDKWLDNPELADEDAPTKLAMTTLSPLQIMLSQLPLEGLSNLLSTLSGKEDYSWKTTMGRTLTQIVPFSGLARWINGMVDPTIRKPDSIGETVEAGIPGLSQHLKAIKDSRGLDATRSAWDAFAPYKIGTVKKELVPQYQERMKTLKANAIARRAAKRLAPSSSNAAPSRYSPRP